MRTGICGKNSPSLRLLIGRSIKYIYFCDILCPVVCTEYRRGDFANFLDPVPNSFIRFRLSATVAPVFFLAHALTAVKRRKRAQFPP